jgi:hypothetical protein
LSTIQVTRMNITRIAAQTRYSSSVVMRYTPFALP